MVDSRAEVTSIFADRRFVNFYELMKTISGAHARGSRKIGKKPFVQKPVKSGIVG